MVSFFIKNRKCACHLFHPYRIACYVLDVQDALKAYKKIQLEMITLLALFSIENLFLCIPIFILWHNISQRNSYLETLYAQLPEEEVS